MTSSRDAMLSAVFRAAGNGPESRAAVADRLASRKQNVRPLRSADDPNVIARFAEEAARAGTDVIRAASLTDVPTLIAKYVRDMNMPGDIRVATDPALAGIPWQMEPGLRVETGPAKPEDTASLSMAYCGVAETGTLVMRSSPENPTMLNYLPFLHIGMLPEEKIVGGLETAWALLREQFPQTMPRMINLITGPSRTADIEQELLMGAHGPQKHMIIMLKGK